MRVNKVLFKCLLCVICAGIVIPVHSEEETEIVVNDLLFGQSLYNFYQGKYFSAITNLMVSEKKGMLEKQGQDAQVFLGGLYLGYELHQEADKIFSAMIDEAKVVSLDAKDRAWFYLGKTQYRQNEFSEAKESFLNVKDALPAIRENERLNYVSNIFIKENNYEKAIENLHAIDKDSSWKNFAQFNVGVSYVRQGKIKEGITELEAVGNIKSKDNEMSAIRDKANLALGYTYIREKNYKKSHEYFKKIRLTGPQSNKALLGLGWAYLSSEAYNNALVSWLELEDKSILDPSVQEALLAIPYTLEKLDKKALAIEKYNTASKRYDEELLKFNTVKRAITKGELIAALRPGNLGEEAVLPRFNTTLPESITVPYIQKLLATHEFQAAFNRYQDLMFLDNVIQSWFQYLPVYKLMLVERKKAYKAKLPAIQNDSRLKKIKEYRDQQSKLVAEFETGQKEFNVEILANSEELEVLHQLNTIGDNIQKIGSAADSDLIEKYMLLSGIVQWDIEKDIVPRTWAIKSEIKSLDQALADSDKAYLSLKQTFKNAPSSFAGFEKRINNRFANLKNMRANIKGIINDQENYIKGLALKELDLQKLRLENYNMRVKFALARLYDSMAIVEERGE